MGGPLIHQRSALGECVSAAITLFRLVADCMRKGGLDNFAWDIGTIASPVAKCAAEAVDRGAIFEPLDQMHERAEHTFRHLGGALTGEDVSVGPNCLLLLYQSRVADSAEVHCSD
jgi:hypothetical protein